LVRGAEISSLKGAPLTAIHATLIALRLKDQVVAQR